jgi:hypothetical protein
MKKVKNNHMWAWLALGVGIFTREISKIDWSNTVTADNAIEWIEHVIKL